MLQNFRIDAHSNIPVKLVPSSYLPDANELRNSLTPVVVEMMRRYRFTDKDGIQWQGSFVDINSAEPGEMPMLSRVFILVVIGDDSDALFDIDELYGPKYVNTRYNHVIFNSNVFMFPFDNRADSAITGQFFYHMCVTFSFLTTDEILSMIFSWIHDQNPYRKSPVDYTRPNSDAVRIFTQNVPVKYLSRKVNHYHYITEFKPFQRDVGGINHDYISKTDDKLHPSFSVYAYDDYPEELRRSLFVLFRITENRLHEPDMVEGVYQDVYARDCYPSPN